MDALTSSSHRMARAGAWGDAALAVLAALAMLAFHAVRGFPTLADSAGDNDSVLRLVQVRDLLAGQGWFDPFQYRMGLEGGFAMHWSRLVDAPIAVLIQIFGETGALIIWPTLLIGICLYLIVRGAVIFGGAEARMPALIVGALSLYFLNIFVPGALDHHSIQLALVLGALVALLDGKAPMLAGICAALMLAIGMEAAPYAATACAIAALTFLMGGDDAKRIAQRFGAGFSATCLAVFVTTVPAQNYLVAACDAFSLPQASLGILGAAGLAFAASLPQMRASLGQRAAALAIIAVGCGLLAVIAFPQCLADPYADLDPRLRQYWLDEVSEAQSVFDILRADIAQFVTFYATPLVAVGVLVWIGWRQGLSRNLALVATFLIAAIGVSFWQVRGSTFSISIAIIALSAWIGVMRARAEADKSLKAQALMVVAWLASVSVVWQMAAMPFALDSESTATETPSTRCYNHDDFAELENLPSGKVAAISNLGSSILRNTSHSVLAGPYHRNQAGNLANLDLMMATPDEARARAASLGIDYIVTCAGNAETVAISEWAPEGLLAVLAAKEPPAWLTLEDDGMLTIWRVEKN